MGEATRFSRHNHLGGFSSACAECNPPHEVVSEGRLCMVTTEPEPVLARDWNTPEEDEAWKSLAVATTADKE
jgi:hypothetical protein